MSLVNIARSLTLSRGAHRAHTAWPATPGVIGPARNKRAFQRYKYAVLLALTTGPRQRLLQHLDKHPDWRRLFLADPTNFYVVFRRYLDRRWSLRQRFERLSVDLELAASKFGPVVTRRVAERHSVRVCELPFFSVDLMLNKPTRIEGFWALSLNDGNNRQLFNLSFGFTAPDTVLIASVQGIKHADGDNIDAIRSLTKQAHGLRPHFLLLEIFKMMCAGWGCDRILGIDSEHQVTRFKKKEDEFKFDYRVFWQEHGACQLPDGSWLLDRQSKRRSREEIPTHKRAMYRRRYELLDQLAVMVADTQRSPAGANDATKIAAA